MINELKRIISESESIVFFGGAGVSTESGIPDFRGSDGLYEREDESGYSPEELLNERCLRLRPRAFFDYYRSNMIYENAEPNEAHRYLAELERQGKLSAIVTQNIDGLHQKAGSKNVIEIHGSVHRNYCVKCGKTYTLSHILDSSDIPTCECGGIVRPDVVLYSEGLGSAFFEAEEAIYNADTLIVGGTSLTVHPACTLLDSFEGEHLIIINQTPTPYDGYAELIIREPIGEVFEELMNDL